jgi:DNA-binding GntR family transcriptional regulator
MIEPYLIRHAVKNITPQQVTHLKSIVERSRKTKAVKDWAGLNIDFHRTLFQAAGKPLAIQVLDNLLVRADRYLKLQNFRSSTTKEESDAQHAHILKCVASGDAEGAAKALSEHIHWNADDMKNSLNISQPQQPQPAARGSKNT